MNELQTQTIQLPDTIEDLTQFVLVGKAKLQAYMLKLQTVNKLSVAQGIRDQTLQEAQAVSSALIAAEQRIGELLLAIPKASGGDRRSENFKSDDSVHFEKTKAETISEMGYSERESKDYQQMAKHPEVVQKVIDDAIANGTVVTKSQVMKEIKASNEETERLKRIISEKEAENIRLRNQKTEIREVIKEVVPDDYEELKAKVDISRKDYSSLHKEYEHMADKWKQSEREKRELLDKMNNPKEQQEINLKNDCIFFCSGIRNFLSDHAKYEYLKDEINALPKEEQQAYMRSISAIREWAERMLGEVTI